MRSHIEILESIDKIIKEIKYDGTRYCMNDLPLAEKIKHNILCDKNAYGEVPESHYGERLNHIAEEWTAQRTIRLSVPKKIWDNAWKY